MIALASFESFRRKALGQEPADAARAARRGGGVARAALATATEERLWALHRDATARAAERAGDEASLLDLKVELARRLLGPCRLCQLRCPVDRRAGQVGACGLGAGLRPYQDFVHLGEELELIPTHAVYLAGCSYRCPTCSDWTHVDRPTQHAEVDPAALGRSIAARRRAGALSVSFVGGSPDVNLPGLLEALRAAETSVPAVWNSNLSGTPEAHDLLAGVVDAWVADLKFGAEDCARVGAGVKETLPVVHRNLLRVAREAYTIVRHLVVPGHVDCCALPVLDWLAEELPGVRVNVMGQFRPTPRVKGSPWDRLPTASELDRARAHAEALPLDLVGPGRIEAPLASGSGDDAAVAGFESRIEIDEDGRVVIENLSPELAALLGELGDLTGDLGERRDAGEAWRAEAGEPAPGRVSRARLSG